MAETSVKESLLSMIKDVDDAQEAMHKDLGLNLKEKIKALYDEVDQAQGEMHQDLGFEFTKKLKALYDEVDQAQGEMHPVDESRIREELARMVKDIILS